MNANAVQVTLTNEDEEYRFSDFTEDLADDYTHGELFRMAQREYGRCVSAIYHDGPDGTKAVGWYFEKRMQYDDCNDTYLRGAWVTPVHVARKIEYA